VANANTQTAELCIVAKGLDDVSKAIMATVAATVFESGNTGGHIEFIVYDKYVFGAQLIETSYRRDGLTATVHKSGRHHHTKISACQGGACAGAKKTGFCL
jgi:hypothetical protein